MQQNLTEENESEYGTWKPFKEEEDPNHRPSFQKHPLLHPPLPFLPNQNKKYEPIMKTDHLKNAILV